MDLETELIGHLLPWLSAWLEGHGASALLVTLIWRLYRRNRYLSEALARSEQRNLEQHNETVKDLVTIFAHAPRPTLNDLANPSGEDFELRSSETPSDSPPPLPPPRKRQGT